MTLFEFERRIKDKYPVGSILSFHSGNFEGLTGEVLGYEFSPEYMFGVLIKVKLSDGRIGNVEKSEHFKIITP